MRNLDKEASEFLRYLMVGAANAFAGLVLYFILLRGLNVNYVLANFLAFTLWSWFGFQLQRIYAFRASRTHLGFLKFLTNHLLFFLSSSLLLVTLVELIGFSPEISYFFVLALSSFGVYFVSKLFIFSKREKKFREGGF